MDILGLIQSGAASVLGPVALTTNLNASAPVLVSPIPGAPPGASGQASGGSYSATRVLEWLQPKVAIQLPTGAFAVAPFGEPTADYSITALATLLALGLAVAALGAGAGRGAAKHLAIGAGIAGVVAFVSSRTAVRA